MASPQKENGYTPIANEIMEALAKTNLNAYQSRIVIAILRKTYGYKKKEDWISISQLVGLTGIKKSHVCRAKKELLDKKIVTYLGNKIGLNKDYSQWLELPRKVTVTSLGNTVTSLGNKSYLVRDTQKKKENIQKKIYNSEILFLSDFLFKKIIENNPNFKGNPRKWDDDIDKLIRIDGRSHEEAAIVIAFAQNDRFWKSNILSGEKLRKQYDRLWIKAKEEYEKKQSNQIQYYGQPNTNPQTNVPDHHG